jgi:hypothetical protein
MCSQSTKIPLKNLHKNQNNIDCYGGYLRNYIQKVNCVPGLHVSASGGGS